MIHVDIKNYLEESIPELKGHIDPVMTTDISEICVIYNITDISVSHVNQSQMTFTVVSEDFDEGIAMQEKIKEFLAMEEDDPYRIYGESKSHTSLSAGGGNLFDEGPQRWEISKIYIVDWRKTHGKN